MSDDFVVFEHIPGVRTVWVRDNGDEWEIITDYHNAEATKDANAALREDSEGKRFGDYRLLASMPPNELRATGLEAALRQGDDKFISRWMNDSDNRGYRASRGRV
jgi:hypothetical protein